MDEQRKTELEQELGKKTDAELRLMCWVSGIPFGQIEAESLSPRYALISAIIDATEKEEPRV